MNENPEGNNEWLQPSFVLTQKAVFTFSETEGCHLELLLKDKDIPPGKGGAHVFETSLQFPVCRWTGGGRWFQCLGDISHPGPHTPPCSAVSGTLNGANCLLTVLALLRHFGRKHREATASPLARSDFHLICLYFLGFWAGCYFQRSGLGKI